MVYIFIAAVIFFADLWIKNYVEREFPEEGERKKLKGFLRLRRHYNRGAFLNVGQRKRRVVAGLSVCLTACVLILFILTLGTKGNTVLKTGLAMLLGGAFSNTYDRLKRKYVVDYFSFGVKWKWFSRMVFNISDFGIIIGALMAALSVYEN
jgi:Lipoprotein signal peptidase